MSKYHVLGIFKNTGKLDELAYGSVRRDVLDEALESALNYRQLFLVSDDANVRELIYTPPPPPTSVTGTLEDGEYMPKIRIG